MAPLTPEQHFARYRDLGDLDALAAVFDAVAARLLLVAGHLVRDGATAEDLVQTTFVQAMRSAQRYDARRPLLPWLAQILTHHAKKLHRSQLRVVAAPGERERVERGPVEHALDRETMAAVQSGLARLPAQYEQVLTLRLVHELSPTAIAHALGCPPETVKTRLKRGLERLRRHLPAGLATSLAVLLASGRGTAAVRADVLLHARHLAGKVAGSGTAAAAATLALGGFAMKQFLLRATVVVAVLALGWWGIELSTRPTPSPSPAPGGAALVVANGASATESGEPIVREALAEKPAASGIVFVGRCVAADTGEALPGVNAVAFRQQSETGVFDNEIDHATVAARMSAGADGTFALRCVRQADVRFAVRVGNHEHVHRVRSFGPYTEDRVVELGDVPLTIGVKVTAAVVDRRGVPAAGVRVTVSGQHAVGRNDMLMLDTGYPWRSDANGEIHVPYAMLPGSYQVTWWEFGDSYSSGWPPFAVPAGSATHRVVLVWPVDDASQTIRGLVVDEQQQPIVGLHVGAQGGGTRGNAYTQEDGTFCMPRVGPYDASARGPVEFGSPDATCGLVWEGVPTANWGDQDLRLVVPSAATLVVRAVDATTGAPVAIVDVACAMHGDDGSPLVVVWDRRNRLDRSADGSVRRRLTRRVHDVQVFPSDRHWAPSCKVPWDPRNGADLVVPLTAVRECTLRVLTNAGEPVVGTEVWTLQPIEAVAGAPAASGWQEVAVPVAGEQLLDPTTRWARHGIDDAPLGSGRTDSTGRVRVPVPVATDVVFGLLGPGHVPKAVVGHVAGDGEVELRVDAGASVRFVLTPEAVVQRLLRSGRHRRIDEASAEHQGTHSVVLQLLRIDLEPDAQRAEAAIQIPITPGGICEHRGLRPGRYATAIGGSIESGSMDGIGVVWQPGPVLVRDGERNEIPIDVSRWAVGRVKCQVLVNGEPWKFGDGHLWSMSLIEEQGGSSGYLTSLPEYRSVVDVRTDGEGRFDVEAVPGDYQLHLLSIANARGGSCCPVEPVRVVAGTTQQLVLTARDVTARVRLVDAAGAPAAGLTVTLDYTTVPSTTFEWTTDDDGWITIPLAPPVPFHLIVKNPNGPPRPGARSPSSGDATLGPFLIPPTGDRAEFRAQLPEGWR